MEPMEFLARFEQWACARTKGICCSFDATGRKLTLLIADGRQENLQTMRADCTRLILTGLRKYSHFYHCREHDPFPIYRNGPKP